MQTHMQAEHWKKEAGLRCMRGRKKRAARLMSEAQA